MPKRPIMKRSTPRVPADICGREVSSSPRGADADEKLEKPFLEFEFQYSSLEEDE